MLSSNNPQGSSSNNNNSQQQQQPMFTLEQMQAMQRQQPLAASPALVSLQQQLWQQQQHKPQQQWSQTQQNSEYSSQALMLQFGNQQQQMQNSQQSMPQHSMQQQPQHPSSSMQQQQQPQQQSTQQSMQPIQPAPMNNMAMHAYGQQPNNNVQMMSQQQNMFAMQQAMSQMLAMQQYQQQQNNLQGNGSMQNNSMQNNSMQNSLAQNATLALHQQSTQQGSDLYTIGGPVEPVRPGIEDWKHTLLEDDDDNDQVARPVLPNGKRKYHEQEVRGMRFRLQASHTVQSHPCCRQSDPNSISEFSSMSSNSGPMQTRMSPSMNDINLDGIAPTPLSEIKAKSLRQQGFYQEQTNQVLLPKPETTNPQAMWRQQQLQQQQFQQQQQSLQQLQQQQQARQQQTPQSPVQTQPSSPVQRSSPLQPSPQRTPSPTKTSHRSPPSAPPAASSNHPFILPSTMMPPSVLASVYSSSKQSSNPGRYKRRSADNTKSVRTESPQGALERILSTRGYGNSFRVKSDEACYDTLPSALQLASFGTELVKAVHTSDVKTLSELLSCGLSPNPCNQFRDSIVDLVCKRSNTEVFVCLVENGCELRVCDGFGRTPLHHCCWASEFSHEIAETIIRQDMQQLFMEDKRGQTPLEYIRPDQAQDWINFLEDRKNDLFPVGGQMPQILNLKDSRPTLPDPANALPPTLAAHVSSGQMSVAEASDLSPEVRARFE